MFLLTHENEMQLWYNWDDKVMQMWWKFNVNEIQTQCECDENAMQIWCKYNTNVMWL